VTDEELLRFIKDAARVRQYTLRRHALKRMAERCISEEDVREAMMSATEAVFDPDEKTWRVTGGTDLDGEPTGLGISAEWSVFVVTVF